MSWKGQLNSFSESMIDGFDKVIVGNVQVSSGKLNEHINEASYVQASETSLDRADSKAGSVLTHISMMIAAATFVVSSTDTHWLEKLIIGFELCAYLLLALCCLRCLVYVDIPKGFGELTGGGDASITKRIRRQVVVRSSHLNFAIRWTFVVTFVFALSLAAHLAF